MRIIELREENVKRIKACQINPDPHMVVVEGRNAQGKTSLLDGILYTLAGGKTIPDQVVRDGQDTAFVTIDVGDYKITRKWTKLGTTLKIETKEGLVAPSPQAMLDALIGHLAFDPMEFCTKDRKDRTALLKKVAGLNFDDLELQYKKAYDERTFVNREVDQAEAVLKSMPIVQDIIVQDIKDIQAKRAEAVQANAIVDAASRAQQTLEANFSTAERLVARLKSELAAAELDVVNLRNKIGRYVQGSHVPVTHFDDAISNHSQGLIQHERFLQREKAAQIVTDKQAKSKSLTETLQKILAEKEARLASSNMPIPGLNFINGDVSFNGIEFGQISMGQKIQISMAIAMALNPKLKIIRIMNGSLLDDVAMAAIKDLAVAKDFQVWIERVANSKTGTAIYIEEGEVK